MEKVYQLCLPMTMRIDLLILLIILFLWETILHNLCQKNKLKWLRSKVNLKIKSKLNNKNKCKWEK